MARRELRKNSFELPEFSVPYGMLRCLLRSSEFEIGVLMRSTVSVAAYTFDWH